MQMFIVVAYQQSATLAHLWEKITYVSIPQEVQRECYLPDILG